MKILNKLQRNVSILTVLCLTFLALTAYSRSIAEVSFVEDDIERIWWAIERGTFEYVVKSFNFVDQFHYFRPVSNVYFALTAPLFGLDSSYYHGLSLILHIAVGWLVFRLISRITKNQMIGFFAGCFFIIYPGTAKVVFWIASVNESIAVLFYLVSVLSWIKFIECRKCLWAITSIASGTLALLSKEIAVTLPLILLLVEVAFLGVRKRRTGFHLLAWHGWGVIWVSYSFVQWKVTGQNNYASGNYTIMGLHIPENGFAYIGYLIWPFDATLPFLPISGIVALGFMSFWAILSWRNGNRWIAFLVLWTCIAILPVLPFTWEVRGRYLYLAVVAWSGLVAIAFTWLLQLLRGQLLRISIAVVISTVMIFLSLSDISRRVDTFTAITDIRRSFLSTLSSAQPHAPESGCLTFLQSSIRPGGVHSAVNLLYNEPALMVLIDPAKVPDDCSVFLQHGGRWRSVNIEYDNLNIVQAMSCCNLSLGESLVEQISTSTNWMFTNGFQLSSYAIDDSILSPGEMLLLVLNWKMESSLQKDYTVFVHFVDTNLHRWGQMDKPLQIDGKATSQWSEGDSVSDYYLIPRNY